MLNVVKFIKDSRGVTAIEYTLMAALIAVVSIGGMTLVGSEVKTTFECVDSAIGGGGGECDVKGQATAKATFKKFYNDMKRGGDCNGYGACGWVLGQTVYETARDIISKDYPAIAERFKNDPGYMESEMLKMRNAAEAAASAAGLEPRNWRDPALAGVSSATVAQYIQSHY